MSKVRQRDNENCYLWKVFGSPLFLIGTGQEYRGGAGKHICCLISFAAGTGSDSVSQSHESLVSTGHHNSHGDTEYPGDQIEPGADCLSSRSSVSIF